ncbi:MAG: DOMON-like domain-containing protein [Gammaproteobacteria bacterium]|nr:DOMON-like domain-containing protein [Gammaproteobacteria bacterium]
MQLHPHHDFPCHAVTRLEADARCLQPDILVLDWRLGATPGLLVLPEPGVGRRRDGLWRHACFEAFIGSPGTTAYQEFNFSPSGDWAAYRFSGHRRDMERLDLAMPPLMRWQRAPGQLQLTVSLPAWPLPSRPLRIALCAVVETTAGAMGYWALRHPPGAPDFHHEAGRVLELAPPRAG